MILLGNSRSEHRCDSSIHRVPALFKHAKPRFDFEVVGCAHHLARAADGRKHRMRVLGGHWKDHDRESTQRSSFVHTAIVSRFGDRGAILDLAEDNCRHQTEFL